MECEARGKINGNPFQYYFPRGYFGIGLNVKHYDNGDNVWLDMHNENQWVVLMHGTSLKSLDNDKGIVKSGFSLDQSNR